MIKTFVGVLLASFVSMTSAGVWAASFDRAQFVGSICAQDQASKTNSLKSVIAGASDMDIVSLQWIRTTLQAYSKGEIYCTPEGEAYVRDGDHWTSLSEPAKMTSSAPAGVSTPFLSLPLRRQLQTTVSALSILVAPSDDEKIAAAGNLQNSSGELSKALIDRALSLTKNVAVENALRNIRIDVVLHSGTVAERKQALSELASAPNISNRNRILNALSQDSVKQNPELEAAAKRALSHIDAWLEVGKWMTIAYQGLSYGSVLFMAALGLAVIFGLMGVINLAQGEFIMLGAYMTWFVQEALRQLAPGMLDWYLVIAIPFAFGGPALIGMIIEWAIVRHLYHRPLMTLLATWGISLLLINLVRVTIGTQNIGFYTPSYLTGGISVLGNFSVTWARLVSIAFAFTTLILTLFILFKTRIGLEIRATTQHRKMAACVGISTRRIDSLTFAFGSGLAGLAGLAMAMIYNVNPTMGTSFIVDSFIVVVVGGVGSVLGTAVAALGIGQVNAIIQPFYGSVVAKVIVLLAVILFIQQKPGGLFPRKGRR